MTDFPDALSPRLTKLLPLLGSDKDGEVLGAVHAIRRTLASAGRDLHDLAAAVTRPEPPPRIVSREPSPAQRSAATATVSTMTAKEARERIAWVLEEPTQLRKLTPWEDEFLRSLRDSLRAGRLLSEKQTTRLAKIYVRCFMSGDYP